MRIDTVAPHEIGEHERARWRALQDSAPFLANPSFSFPFAAIMAAEKPDARIAIIEDGRLVRGFLPVQRPSRFSAMPLGAPFSNSHGLVSDAALDVSLADVCRALKVGRLDFTHAPAEGAAFARHAHGRHPAWIAELGNVGYRAQLRRQRPSLARELARKERKLKLHFGDVQFLAVQTPATLDTLIDWKAKQLREARQERFFNAAWLKRVLRRSLDCDERDYSGIIFALMAGDRPLALNYCLRGSGVLQGQMMAFDAAFAAYSPGVQLIVKLIEWAQANGFREVDFGGGGGELKRQLATTQRDLVWGSAGPPSFSSAVRQTQYAVRRRIERSPNAFIAGLPARAMRRIDVMRGLGAVPLDSVLESPSR